MIFSVLCRIKIFYEKPHPYPFGVIAHKPLIAVRLIAAKMEVAMCESNVITASAQKLSKHHRVNAAAQSDEDTLIFPDKVMILNILLKPTNHLKLLITSNY